MASIPRAFNSGTSALTVSASSLNSRPATPTGETMVGVPFNVRPMKAIGNAIEFPDFVRREHGLPGRFVDRAGREIVKRRAGKRMRPLAFVDWMTAAILHPKQFILAFVEFVVADRSDRKPHHRQRFDGRLVVKHRRQKRAGADQVSGGDEDGVLVPLAQLLNQRGHGLDAPGRHHHLPGLVVGIGDPDAARRRAKVAMEVVDGENPHIDRRGRFGESRGRGTPVPALLRGRA